MYFLDVVFPLQYPMYRPSFMEEGRGWILSLLLRSKPFYFTALALSAQYQKASNAAASSTNSLSEQETQQSLYLMELQPYIRNVEQWAEEAERNELPGIMASVLHLIFLDVSLSTMQFMIHQSYS
jgi:hypothetical protein